MLKERLSGMLSVQKSLQIEFSEVCKRYSRGKQLDEVIFALPSKKLEKIGVRGYFVRKVYDYIQAQAKLEDISLRSDLPSKWFDVSLPFLAEMIISLQYYHNQILDRKGGVTSPVAINRNLIAANLLRSFINWYITDTFKEDLETMHAVQDTVEKILTCVDVGQFMDKNWGTYECFVNGLPEDTWLGEEIEEFIDVSVIDWIWEEIHKSGISVEHERFVRHYLKRIYLTNASLFVLMAKIIGNLLCYQMQNFKTISTFAGYAYIGLQIMNDNFDIVPPKTIAKVPEDQFSDLRNQNVTLPWVYFFSSNFETSIYHLIEISKENSTQLVDMLTNNAMCFSIPISKKIIVMASKNLYAANPQFALLNDLTSAVFDSEYYNYIVERYE